MIERSSTYQGPRGWPIRPMGRTLVMPLVVMLGFVLAASGCKPGAKGGSGSADPKAGGDVSVRGQCDRLLIVVQQDRSKLDAVEESADFEKDTRRSASAFQVLRDDISQANAQDSDLKKIASDYQAALTQVVTDLNGIASASKGSDTAKVDQLSKQFDIHIQAVNVADKRLGDYCAKK